MPVPRPMAKLGRRRLKYGRSWGGGRADRRRKKSWAAVARRRSAGGGADAGEAQQQTAQMRAKLSSRPRGCGRGWGSAGAAVPSPAQIPCAVPYCAFLFH